MNKPTKIVAETSVTAIHEQDNRLELIGQIIVSGPFYRRAQLAINYLAKRASRTEIVTIT